MSVFYRAYHEVCSFFTQNVQKVNSAAEPLTITAVEVWTFIARLCLRQLAWYCTTADRQWQWQWQEMLTNVFFLPIASTFACY